MPVEDYGNLDIVAIVMSRIQEQFQEIINADVSTYGGYTFVLTDEQQYVKIDKEKGHKKIYMVVKFLQGSKDYGQQRQPVTINAVSEHNSLDVCQRLMMDFAETYNFYKDEISGTGGAPSYVLKETFSTASSITNFAEVYDGFRSVFYISGTFYFGVNSNPITKIEVSIDNGTSYNELDFLSAQMSYDGQIDSQPFYNTNNFNRSMVKIGTLSLGFTMYSQSTPFYTKILDIVFNETVNNVAADIDKTFKFKIYFVSKGNVPYMVDMKLANVSNIQEIRDFPASSFSFVR